MSEDEDTECPTCGRDDFASVGGMKCHHTKAHGESIATTTVTCDWCGEESTKYSNTIEGLDHHFCDQECTGAWRSENMTGEDAPNWDGGKITVECDWCGEPKQVIPAIGEMRDNHFCDTECMASWQSENQTGENSPTWEGGKYPSTAIGVVKRSGLYPMKQRNTTAISAIWSVWGRGDRKIKSVKTTRRGRGGK